MDRRTKNVEIFKDFVKLMNGSSRLQQAITESQNKQKLYLEKEDVAVPESKGLSCKTVVSTKRSFEAASVYARAGKKVAVLNFASSKALLLSRASICYTTRICRRCEIKYRNLLTCSCISRSCFKTSLC